MSETYLNHPTFGLLFSICTIDPNQALYTTLYAQRLFFVVIHDLEGLRFEPVTRNEARIIVENSLRSLRRSNDLSDFQRLQKIHRQTF